MKKENLKKFSLENFARRAAACSAAWNATLENG